jgi:GNAT superfamily N-acetyltransferase
MLAHDERRRTGGARHPPQRRTRTMNPSTSDDITFRPAVAADALCLGVLATQVFLDTYAPQGIRPAIARQVLAEYSVARYERLLADPGVTILVAERAGHLVGFSQVGNGIAHERVPEAAASELQRLYVHERFTGRGIGRDLLRHAEKAAAASGADTLWLTAYEGNARALQFYPRRGYEDLGATIFTLQGEDHPNRLYGKRIRHVAPA